MVRSDIFDSYAKIMEDNGIIEKTAYPNNDEYRKKLEQTGRQGSDDISTIEALYGINPNGKDDETPIDEKAHPKTVVISPSYDRMNGVVETLQERHNIMVDIALRAPNVNVTGRRYVSARKNLLESLVRVGFLMDSINDEKLTTLADSCSEKLIVEAGFMDWVSDLSHAVPAAAIPAGIAAIFGGPVAWAIAAIPIGMALFNNIRPFSQGVLNDTKNAIVQLQEAKGTVPKASAVLDYTTEMLTNFLQYVEEYMNTESPDINHNSLTDVVEAKNDHEELQKLSVANKYVAKCKEVKAHLATIIVKLQAAEDERSETNLPKGLDYLGGLVNMFWTPAVKDAYQALRTLDSSLEKVIASAGQAHQEAQGTIESLTEQAKSLAEKVKDKVTFSPAGKPENTKENVTPEILNQLTEELGQ